MLIFENKRLGRNSKKFPKLTPMKKNKKAIIKIASEFLRHFYQIRTFSQMSIH